MVGAAAVVRELGIPRSTLYRLVNDKVVPVHEEQKPWHKAPRLRFRLSEVRDALDQMQRRPAPTPPAEGDGGG